VFIDIQAFLPLSPLLDVISRLNVSGKSSRSTVFFSIADMFKHFPAPPAALCWKPVTNPDESPDRPIDRFCPSDSVQFPHYGMVGRRN
jgi:hypothetical protein